MRQTKWYLKFCLKTVHIAEEVHKGRLITAKKQELANETERTPMSSKCWRRYFRIDRIAWKSFEHKTQGAIIRLKTQAFPELIPNSSSQSSIINQRTESEWLDDQMQARIHTRKLSKPKTNIKSQAKRLVSRIHLSTIKSISSCLPH